MTGFHGKLRIKQFSIFLWTDGAKTSIFIKLDMAVSRGFRFPLPLGWIESPVHLCKTHVVFSVSEGKYICHSNCRDLLHLDYAQNGKRPCCMSTSEVRRSSKRDSQVSRDISGSGSILSFRPSVTHAGRMHLWLTKVAWEDQICVHFLCLPSRPVEPKAQLWAVILKITHSLCQEYYPTDLSQNWTL